MWSIVTQYYKVIGFVVLLIGSFWGGWAVCEYKAGYVENIQNKTAQSIKDDVKSSLDEIKKSNSENYNKTKEYLEGQQFKVIKEQIPYIVTKEVYHNVCMEDDGVNALKILRENSKLARGLK